jgi:putative phosphoesterase
MARPEALAALEGTDHIIHAGDIGSPAVIEVLRGVAPVTAVRGNVDVGGWAREFPETAVVERDGVRIYVIHNLKDLDLDPCAAGFSAVVCGHSHAPMEEMRSGVLYFNPGSAGPRRFHLPVSIGCLTIEAGKVSAEIVYLSS